MTAVGTVHIDRERIITNVIIPSSAVVLIISNEEFVFFPAIFLRAKQCQLPSMPTSAYRAVPFGWLIPRRPGTPPPNTHTLQHHVNLFMLLALTRRLSPSVFFGRRVRAGCRNAGESSTQPGTVTPTTRHALACRGHVHGIENAPLVVAGF